MTHVDFHKLPKQDFNIPSYKDDDPYFKSMLLTEAEIALRDLNNVLSQIENQLQDHNPEEVQQIRENVENVSNSLHYMFAHSFHTFV